MCDDCDWEILLTQIDDLLEQIDDRHHESAALQYSDTIETLEGIQLWVLDSSHCTEDQVIAVQNIEDWLESEV